MIHEAFSKDVLVYIFELILRDFEREYANKTTYNEHKQIQIDKLFSTLIQVDESWKRAIVDNKLFIKKIQDNTDIISKACSSWGSPEDISTFMSSVDMWSTKIGTHNYAYVNTPLFTSFEDRSKNPSASSSKGSMEPLFKAEKILTGSECADFFRFSNIGTPTESSSSDKLEELLAQREAQDVSISNQYSPTYPREYRELPPITIDTSLLLIIDKKEFIEEFFSKDNVPFGDSIKNYGELSIPYN